MQECLVKICINCDKRQSTPNIPPLPRRTSHANPLFLRTKLDDPSLYNRLSTEFAPTLHRLWYGGTTEDHRRHNLSKTKARVIRKTPQKLRKSRQNTEKYHHLREKDKENQDNYRIFAHNIAKRQKAIR